MWKTLAVMLSVLGIVGCRDARSYDRKVALELCTAQIAVFPPGQPPQQPYRVVAPVEARWGISATSRFLKLKREACALGANAIIDAGEREESETSVTTTVRYDRWGQPITVVQEQPNTRRRTTALAVQLLPPESPVSHP
jgi:hypothetical protein